MALAKLFSVRKVTSVAGMERQAARWQRQGTRVGLVPTMGSLHAGHLGLMRRARKLVGHHGVVVVSIYVNPTQFAPHEDFRNYPRDLGRDTMLCRDEGVDVLFVPDDQQMYAGKKNGYFSTSVIEESLSKLLEGEARPSHFRGVTTVVAKLFNIVQPDVAVFGAKDFQQAAIVQRMVRDLNFPVRIVVEPTVREADGLALSSRNKYLEGELRTQATVLWHAILKAQAAVRGNKRRLNARTFKAQLKQFIERQPAARVDYVAFFEPATLRPVMEVGRGTHLALAVFIGKTRLIDNASL